MENIDNFHGIKTFDWKGHKWISRELWGIVHQQDQVVYTDVNLPEIMPDGNLLLPIKYNEKGVENRHFGRGLVRTVEEFKYGTFEWDVILPAGEYVWPALWLASDAGWPPEIDALEGWSEKNPEYIKGLLFKNIKPTMHWSKGADEKTGKHNQLSKNNIFRWYIKSGDVVNKIRVIWMPNYVDVYYNGVKIKRFNDPEMLSHFNKPGYKMHVIMSMNVYGEPWFMAGQELGPTPKFMRNFEVVDFRYFPAL